MLVKFIQVNIYKGKYLSELVMFLKDEKPDFVSMQELSANGENFSEDKSIDLFDYLKAELKMQGVVNKDFDVSDTNGYMGNAVLTRFPIENKKVVTLREGKTYTHDETFDWKNFPYVGRHLVDCITDVGGQNIHAMSVHGAWTAPPTDTEITMGQAQIMADYLKSLEGPFILGGDFNAIIQSKTIGILNNVAKNLLFNSGVRETTNPKVHKIAPRGYLIDFIFASYGIKLVDLSVPEITVSDHLPVIARLEIG